MRFVFTAVSPDNQIEQLEIQADTEAIALLGLQELGYVHLLDVRKLRTRYGRSKKMHRRVLPLAGNLQPA